MTQAHRTAVEYWDDPIRKRGPCQESTLYVRWCCRSCNRLGTAISVDTRDAIRMARLGGWAHEREQGVRQ